MMKLPLVREMINQLIATPSVSSTQRGVDQSNLAVINLLAGWLDSAGFDVRILPVTDHPGKANLIAKIGSGKGGLVLSGHSDTVPFDEHLWHSDPFRVTEKDNKWYGLGTADMKSFFALALEAYKSHYNTSFSHPLYILATADEESSMSGARMLDKELEGASFAVIGEPTNLVPVTRHKGIYMLNLRIEGHSGHSSNPELGNNAIEGIHLALGELIEYREHLARNFSDSSFSVAYPTLNFGCLHGGDNPNRICDHAELEFDFRNLPSMDMSDFLGELQARIQNAIADKGLTSALKMLHPPVPAFENSDSVFAKHLETLSRQKSQSVAFGTEAPFLANLGIDTVVLGPGSIDQAHQPNEYLDPKEVQPTVTLLSQLIDDYCL